MKLTDFEVADPQPRLILITPRLNGITSLCYARAAEAAQSYGLRYAEGLADTGIRGPVHHAWVLNAKDAVIEDVGRTVNVVPWRRRCQAEACAGVRPRRPAVRLRGT